MKELKLICMKFSLYVEIFNLNVIFPFGQLNQSQNTLVFSKMQNTLFVCLS